MRMMFATLVASLAVAFAAPACAVDGTTADESSQAAELSTLDDGAGTNVSCPANGALIPGWKEGQYYSCLGGCTDITPGFCKMVCCQQVTGCSSCRLQ